MYYIVKISHKAEFCNFTKIIINYFFISRKKNPIIILFFREIENCIVNRLALWAIGYKMIVLGFSNVRSVIFFGSYSYVHTFKLTPDMMIRRVKSVEEPSVKNIYHTVTKNWYFSKTRRNFLCEIESISIFI